MIKTLLKQHLLTCSSDRNPVGCRVERRNPIRFAKATKAFLETVKMLQGAFSYSFSLILLVLLLVASNLFAQNELQFDMDFPGGNIIINQVSNDTVYLEPDLRDTEGDWFYWYFGVEGAEGRDLTFQFDGVRKMAAYGPAVSTDKGKTWKWLYQEHGVRDRFSYEFPTDGKEIRFCMAMPYLESDLYAFLAKHRNNPSLDIGTLCLTRKGRPVEKITIGQSGKDAKYKVLITGRHHAGEMMASYVLEGIMDALLSGEKDMNWLRRNVEFLIIPFVDKDGVEDGDQGKNRNGRDHNRDYGGESIYATTATIRNEIPGWAENKLRIAFDLHDPYVNATTVPRNETIFLVGSPDKDGAAEQKKFMNLLEKNKKEELIFRTDNSFMSYGTEWNSNSGSSQGERFTFTRWARAKLENVPLISTIEFPFAHNDGQMVTQKNARGFGKDLAHAIAIYLQQLER